MPNKYVYGKAAETRRRSAGTHKFRPDSNGGKQLYSSRTQMRLITLFSCHSKSKYSHSAAQIILSSISYRATSLLLPSQTSDYLNDQFRGLIAATTCTFRMQREKSLLLINKKYTEYVPVPPITLTINPPLTTTIYCLAKGETYIITIIKNQHNGDQ